MYIPDELWDELMGESCEMIEYIDSLQSSISTSNDLNIFQGFRGILQNFVNLQDQPIPKQKRKPLNSFQKARKVRETMRSFTRYFIVRLVNEYIKNNRVAIKRQLSYNVSQEKE